MASNQSHSIDANSEAGSEQFADREQFAGTEQFAEELATDQGISGEMISEADVESSETEADAYEHDADFASAELDDSGESSIEASDDALYLNDPRGTEISSKYVDRWEVLISTTNWEKGRIICDWRSALQEDGAPVSAYSDEAWSQRVGGVTSQHVGRLRRVAARFGSTRESYPKLSWTHFLAALDWDDAEMWLEGAVQSKWSVSNMRQAHWEAQGSDPANEPMAADLSSTATDEDFTPLSEPVAKNSAEDKDGEVAEGPRYDGPDFGDEDEASTSNAVSAEGDDEMPWDEAKAEPLVSPFASLPRLPVDVADALEQFKLAIIRHRSSGWQEVSQSDLLQTLDALKNFASQ